MGLIYRKPIFFGAEEFLGFRGNLTKEIFNHPFCNLQYEIIDKKIVLSKRGKPLFHDLMLDIKNLNISDQEIENLINAYGRTDLKGLILKEIEKRNQRR